MQPPLVRSPVYQQLNDRLRTTLANEYHAGDKFLTEREISDQFQVSRATANKALAGLVSEGLLEFRKGIGTFVRRDVIGYDVRTLVSFTEKARTAGKKPSTELVDFRRLPASDAADTIRQSLEIEPSETLCEMKRVRRADGVPVILEHRFLVHALCPKLTRSQAEGSLYRAWTEVHGLEITGADEVIRAVLLTAEEAGLLKTSARMPALEVISVGKIAGERPFWFERTLYRGDQYEFHSRLGGLQSSTPARGMLR